APRQFRLTRGPPLLLRMRIQCLAMRRSRRPRLPGLSEAVAGKMSASDSSRCQTLRGHRKTYGWELFRGLSTYARLACLLLTANFLLPTGQWARAADSSGSF